MIREGWVFVKRNGEKLNDILVFIAEGGKDP